MKIYEIMISLCQNKTPELSNVCKFIQKLLQRVRCILIWYDIGLINRSLTTILLSKEWEFSSFLLVVLCLPMGVSTSVHLMQNLFSGMKEGIVLIAFDTCCGLVVGEVTCSITKMLHSLLSSFAG